MAEGCGSKVFSFRACLIGICSMVFLGLWVQFHEVLSPSANILAENSPPAGAVGIFIGVMLLIALVSFFNRSWRLHKGELLVIYTMLVIAAPLMSQGMWHRFLGLLFSVPRSQEYMMLVDSFSDKLWPHGPQLIDDRRFAKGLGEGVVAEPPDRVRPVKADRSQVGAVGALELSNPAPVEDSATTDLPVTTLRVRVDRERNGKEVLVPGERYYCTALFDLKGFKSQTSLDIDLLSDKGTRTPIQSLRRDTEDVYSKPGGFMRAGEPYVDMPRDVDRFVEIVFTLTGEGTARVTDLNFFSMEAVARAHKGTSEIAAGLATKLDRNQRDALLVRPDNIYSPAGIWYTIKGYIPWSQWAGPLLYWTSIVMAMFLCLLGIGVIFRKQWAENERFAFPLVVLPRLLMEEKDDGTRCVRPLFRHAGFRGGVVAAFVYCLLLGLAYYIPGMPNPAVNVNLADYFSSPAMKAFVNGMSSGTFAISLLFGSIAFFIELDMLLSIIVFMWICKIPYYMGEVFGWKTIKGPVDNFPFPHEQHMGAFLCLALIVFWVSRKHLAGVWKRIWNRPGGVDDSKETMSYRAAVLMIVSSFIFFALWGEATGLGWGSALTFFGFLVVCGLSASRIRTECGGPATYFTPYFPYLLFFMMGGAALFGTSTMLLTYMAGGFMAVAQFLMFAPSQVEMMHLADTEKVGMKPMKWALILGAIGGVLIGGYVLLVWCYGIGGDNIPYMRDWGIGQDWYFRSLRDTVAKLDGASLQQAATATKSSVYEAGPLAGMIVGAVVTMVVTILRSMIVGFWLHPIGYILANSHFVGMCWGSLLTAWVIKWIALKVGGPKLIRDKMTPMFAGVFVGVLVGMLFWDVVAMARLSMGLRDVFTGLP